MASYTHTITSTRFGDGDRYFSTQDGASISCIASLAGFQLVNSTGPTSKGKRIEYKTLHLPNMPNVPVVTPADAGGGDDDDDDDVGNDNRGRMTSEARIDPRGVNKLLSSYKPDEIGYSSESGSGYSCSQITWNQSTTNPSQWYTNSSSRTSAFADEALENSRDRFLSDFSVGSGPAIPQSEPISVFFAPGVGRDSEGQVYASSSSIVDSSLTTTVNTNAGIRSRSASDPSSQFCTVTPCSDQERARSSSFPNPYTFSTDASTSSSLNLTAQLTVSSGMRDMVPNWSIPGKNSHSLDRNSSVNLSQPSDPTVSLPSHEKQTNSPSPMLSLPDYGMPNLNSSNYSSQCITSNYVSIPDDSNSAGFDPGAQTSSDMSSVTPPLRTRSMRASVSESLSQQQASAPQNMSFQNYQLGFYEPSTGTVLDTRLANESKASAYAASKATRTVASGTEKTSPVPHLQQDTNTYISSLFNYHGDSTSIYSPTSSSAGPGPSTIAYQLNNRSPSSRAAFDTISSDPPQRSNLSPPTPPSLAPTKAVSTSVAQSCSGKASQSTVTAKTKDRKRNHPCWMCHKSFDRPSTLRKHLLVHTGEKAFVCSICGRRFSVASNLNRHTRRCSVRLANAKQSPNSSQTTASRAKTESSISLSSPTFPISSSSIMAREKTNPDVRRAERERDGRQVQDGDPIPHPAPPETPATQHRGRTRSRGLSTISQSSVNADLGDSSSSAYPSSTASVRYQSGPAPLSPSRGRYPSHSIVSASTSPSSTIAVSSNVGEGYTTEGGMDRNTSGEPRPKRRRRAPSPSHWIPNSLQNYSLSPTRARTAAPLPPVSPGYDSTTGAYEERDSFSSGVDENEDPSGLTEAEVAARAERRRNYELAPYHPCGWTGRLPGPAVVLGGDLTNYTKPSSGGGGYYGGGRQFDHPGASSSLMFSFSLNT